MWTGRKGGGFCGPALELTCITGADSPLTRMQSHGTRTVGVGKWSPAVCAQGEEEMGLTTLMGILLLMER